MVREREEKKMQGQDVYVVLVYEEEGMSLYVFADKGKADDFRVGVTAENVAVFLQPKTIL